MQTDVFVNLATALATIAVVITVFIRLDHKDKARFDKLDQKLSNKIDKLDQKLNTKSDTNTDKLDEKLDTKIHKLDEKLDTKIDKLDRKWEGKFERITRDLFEVKISVARIEGFLESHFGVSPPTKSRPVPEPGTEEATTSHDQRGSQVPTPVRP